jgi:hypothetical protein
MPHFQISLPARVLTVVALLMMLGCSAPDGQIAMSGTVPDQPESVMYTSPRESTPQVTTTTVAPAPPPAPTTTHHQPPVTASSSYLGHPCGGQLPPCYVLQREDPSGDPAIWNGSCHAPVGWLGSSPCGTSSASGLWQFIRSTWNDFAGYVNAADAPVEVQNQKAALVWAGGAGCSHWSAC